MIIHITKSISILESIIKTSSFRLSYCEEIFNMGKQRISSAAHPMVCFSEYKDEELQQTKSTYGKYGIAFSKEWAITNNLNPVLYVGHNSQIAKGLAALLKARQGNLASVKLPSELRMPIMQLKCFTKNIRGFNSFLDIEDFDFKQENEWRYVPYKNMIDGNLISEHLGKYTKNRDTYNEKLLDFPLKFKREDITKIFVNNDAEMKTISKMIRPQKTTIGKSPWQ